MHSLTAAILIAIFAGPAQAEPRPGELNIAKEEFEVFHTDEPMEVPTANARVPAPVEAPRRMPASLNKGVVFRGRQNEPGLSAFLETGGFVWKTMWDMPMLFRLMVVLFALAFIFGRLKAMQDKAIREISDPNLVLERSLGENPLLQEAKTRRNGE